MTGSPRTSPVTSGTRPDVRLGRAGRVLAAALLSLATLTGCFGGGSTADDRPPRLEGAALTAEIDRLSDELGQLPHVTSVSLEYTDSATDGQAFGGIVSTDVNDQTELDRVLDGVVRVLWGTKAFYPGLIATSVVSADGAQYADYRTVGGSGQSVLASELVKRYGQPGFLTGSG